MLCLLMFARYQAHEVKLYARDVGRVFTHPSSVNFGVGRYESTWVIYSERVQTEKVSSDTSVRCYGT